MTDIDYIILFGNRFSHTSKSNEGVSQGRVCSAMASTLVDFISRVTRKPVYLAPEGISRLGLVSDIMCIVRSRVLLITTPGSTFAQWMAYLHDGCHVYIPTVSSVPFADLASNIHHVGYNPITDTMAANASSTWKTQQFNITAVLTLWAGHK